MKILLISNMYPSQQNPRYGIFVRNFEKALEKNFNVEFKKVVLTNRNFSSIIKSLFYILYFFKSLVKITFYHYDLVYFHYVYHNAPLAIWASLLNKKVVMNAHGTDVLSKKNIFFEKAINLALHKANLIVVPSDFFSKVIEEKYNLESKNIFTYPSGGIDKNIFNSNAKSITDNNLKLAFVSRIDKNKGWDDFVKAILLIDEQKYKNISVHIIGNGSEEAVMHNMINNHPSITLHGQLDQLSISKVLQECDLFIFPTRLHESLGLVGIEAMACGLPVIGSNIGGLTTYIKNNYNGYLFEPGDFKNLSQQIIKYIDLPLLEKQRLMNNALFTAKEYSSDVVIKNLFLRLKEIL